VPAAHAYNPNLLGDWKQEDHSSRPAWQIAFEAPLSKITRAKWTGGMAQVIEHLFCKHKVPSLNLTNTPNKKVQVQLISI
jgi:hypothetical protein